jgi:predicted Zn-dependent peptidase
MIVGAAIGSSRAKRNAAAQTLAQPAATPTTDDSISQLKQLSELKDQGILTQAEFDAKKKQILGI